jgi:hypothetical protein
MDNKDGYSAQNRSFDCFAMFPHRAIGSNDLRCHWLAAHAFGRDAERQDGDVRREFLEQVDNAASLVLWHV